MNKYLTLRGSVKKERNTNYETLLDCISSIGTAQHAHHRIGIYIFLAGLFLQLLFAGFGVFLGWWGTHVSFGRPFGVITVALLVLALLGRLPARQVWLTVLLIPLYVLQILLVYLPGRHGVIVLATLHPVNAGVMLALGVYLAYWSG